MNLQPAPCLHLTGYWINRKVGTFRCYGCQCQFSVSHLAPRRNRKIESWKA